MHIITHEPHSIVNKAHLLKRRMLNGELQTKKGEIKTK